MGVDKVRCVPVGGSCRKSPIRNTAMPPKGLSLPFACRQRSSINANNSTLAVEISSTKSATVVANFAVNAMVRFVFCWRRWSSSLSRGEIWKSECIVVAFVMFEAADPVEAQEAVSRPCALNNFLILEQSQVLLAREL